MVSPDWSNRRHQIQRRAQSRRVPQLGEVLVRVPAALPVCPRAAIHRAAGGHPVFGQRRKGRTFMCQHSCHTYSWHMHFHALLYTHILCVECLSFSLICFNPGRNHWGPTYNDWEKCIKLGNFIEINKCECILKYCSVSNTGLILGYLLDLCKIHVFIFARLMYSFLSTHIWKHDFSWCF